MNLIEALKTGRKFRRSNMGYDWRENFEEMGVCTVFHLRKEDIIADDWEVEEEPKKKETKTAEISPEVVDAVIAFAAFVEKLIKIDEDKE